MKGVGICFRIRKSHRLAYVSLHSAQRKYAKQKTREMDGFALSFIRTVYSKSEDAKEICLATTLPLIPGNLCEADMDKIAPLSTGT
jgi:hypothetical protein